MKTVLGDFAVDERGFQVGQKAVAIQWQDGKQVVVWPDEMTSGKARFPTPPRSQRWRPFASGWEFSRPARSWPAVRC